MLALCLVSLKREKEEEKKEKSPYLLVIQISTGKDELKMTGLGLFSEGKKGTTTKEGLLMANWAQFFKNRA